MFATAQPGVVSVPEIARNRFDGLRVSLPTSAVSLNCLVVDISSGPSFFKLQASDAVIVSGLGPLGPPAREIPRIRPRPPCLPQPDVLTIPAGRSVDFGALRGLFNDPVVAVSVIGHFFCPVVPLQPTRRHLPACGQPLPPRRRLPPTRRRLPRSNATPLTPSSSFPSPHLHMGCGLAALAGSLARAR